MSLVDTAKRLFAAASPAETAAATAAKLPELRARLDEARLELAALETSTIATNAAAILEGGTVKTPRDLDTARATVSALAAAIEAVEGQHHAAAEAAKRIDRERIAGELIDARKAICGRAVQALGAALAAYRQLARLGVGPLELRDLIHRLVTPVPPTEDFSDLESKRTALLALGVTDDEIRELVPGMHGVLPAHRVDLANPELAPAIAYQAKAAERVLAKSAGIDLDEVLANEQAKAAKLANEQAISEAANKLAKERWIDALLTFGAKAASSPIENQNQYTAAYNCAMDCTALGLPMPAGLISALNDYVSRCQIAGKPARSMRDRGPLSDALGLPAFALAL